MHQQIEDLIHDIWQSANPVTKAEELGSEISQDTQAVIQEVLSNVRARAAARGGLIASGAAETVKERPGSTDIPSAKQSLLLLCFAMYNSDNLTDYPANMRERRLMRWSEETGFPIEITREAVILGQHGLRSLIRASSARSE